jgi:hypothetical protein
MAKKVRLFKDIQGLQAYNKAFVAALVVLIVSLLGHFGFKLSFEVQTALSVVLGGFFVWLVPNKE